MELFFSPFIHYSFHPFIHSLFLHFLNLFFHSWSVAAGVMGSWSQSLSRSTCRLARYRYIQAILCSSFYRICSDSVFLNEGSDCMHLHLLKLRFWFWFRTSKKSSFILLSTPLKERKIRANLSSCLSIIAHIYHQEITNLRFQAIKGIHSGPSIRPFSYSCQQIHISVRQRSCASSFTSCTLLIKPSQAFGA